MKTWFTCKVKYQKVDENGREIKATEQYLIDAISFTEAEARINDEMEKQIRGEFRVQNIAKANYAEVINHEDTIDWYKVKVVTIEYDEESDKEKKFSNYYLVSAESCVQAIERTQAAFESSSIDFDIPAVNLTTIMDVFPFEGEEVPAGVDQETGEVVE